MTSRRSASLAAVLALGLSVLPATIPAQTDEERELARLTSELAELERALDAQIGRRDDGMAELRRIELSLAETRSEIRATLESIDAQTERQSEIAAEQRAASERLGRQREALAEQARVSYMAGPQEFLRLLLSQENAADMSRMFRYYEYLNRYRSEQIAAVDAERSRLAALAAEGEAVRTELVRLRESQEERALRLESDLAERSTLVASMDAAIAATDGRIGQMRAQAAELEDLIARLAELDPSFPVNSDEPFAAHRGDLPMPVAGEVVARFGDRRDDEGLIHWEAMLIDAPAGAEVRAIYHGRVLFANWSSGMGLTMIINHGDGYWSVYGHNGALLREELEWVQAGDVIAEVGNTGGRAEPALYFSIVKDTAPIDPGDWLD